MERDGPLPLLSCHCPEHGGDLLDRLDVRGTDPRCGRGRWTRVHQRGQPLDVQRIDSHTEGERGNGTQKVARSISSTFLASLTPADSTVTAPEPKPSSTCGISNPGATRSATTMSRCGRSPRSMFSLGAGRACWSSAVESFRLSRAPCARHSISL